MLGMVELVDDVGFGLAELSGKSHEPLRGKLLSPEHQHLGGEKGIPHFPEIRAHLVGFGAEAVAQPG